jgi:hypothetical protein
VTGIPQAAKEGNGKRRCGNRRRNAWRTCRRAASRFYFDPVAAAREVGVENPEAFEA